MLFGVQNTVLPWLNNWLFSNANTNVMGVPQQIRRTWPTGRRVLHHRHTGLRRLPGRLRPISGAFFELSRSLGTVGQTLFSGDLAGAVTGLINTPGVVLNGFINGFTYRDGLNPWSGCCPGVTPPAPAGAPPAARSRSSSSPSPASSPRPSPTPRRPRSRASSPSTVAETELVSSNIETPAATITLDLGTDEIVTEGEDAEAAHRCRSRPLP